MEKRNRNLQYSVLGLLLVLTVVAVDLTALRILNSYRLLNGGVSQLANLGACLFAAILQFGWIMIAARTDSKRRWWIGFQRYGLYWILFAVFAGWLLGSVAQQRIWDVYKSGFFGAISSRTLQTVTGLLVFLGIPAVGVVLGIVGGGIARKRTATTSNPLSAN